MKLLRNIAILLLFFVFASNLTIPRTKNYNNTADLEDGVYGEKYETVQIECIEIACILLCQHPADWGTICSWADATWCGGCYDYFDFFDRANGQQMHDYAKDQIENGVLTGTYNSNIIIEDTCLIYRTVTWTADTTSQEAEVNITISDN